MKLWLLEKIGDFEYDETYAFVVRAEDESAARNVAAENAGCEGDAFWLDASRSTCVEVHQEGEPGVILEDHRAG